MKCRIVIFLELVSIREREPGDYTKANACNISFIYGSYQGSKQYLLGWIVFKNSLTKFIKLVSWAIDRQRSEDFEFMINWKLCNLEKPFEGVQNKEFNFDEFISEWFVAVHWCWGQ
jgi:hypothetical protein